MEIIYVLGTAILVAGIVFATFLATRGSRSEDQRQCYECLGSHDPNCASSCGMPS